MSSDKNVKFYGIWDKVVAQGLSKFSFEHTNNWEWDAEFDGRAMRFHLFESKDEAEKAIELLTKTFLEQDSDNEINFVIYELTDLKTVTTYLAKEIKSHKPNKR